MTDTASMSSADDKFIIHPTPKSAPWYAAIAEMMAKWLTAQSTSTILLLIIIVLLTYAGMGAPAVVNNLVAQQAKYNHDMMSRYEENLKQQNVFHEKMIERVTTSFDREVTNVKELVREMRAQR